MRRDWSAASRVGRSSGGLHVSCFQRIAKNLETRNQDSPFAASCFTKGDFCISDAILGASHKVVEGMAHR